ncbi:MAG: hypothetical protein ACYDDA_12570, partial [Acidiferrobacteraceae bacterium]
ASVTVPAERSAILTRRTGIRQDYPDPHRTLKSQQKVSGCFRKAEFAQAYCRISSYLQTMANRGINPLVAIQWLSPVSCTRKRVSSYPICLELLLTVYREPVQ